MRYYADIMDEPDRYIILQYRLALGERESGTDLWNSVLPASLSLISHDAIYSFITIMRKVIDFGSGADGLTQRHGEFSRSGSRSRPFRSVTGESTHTPD